MREILFRAKDTFNEEWVEGYYEFGYDAETEKPSHYMWVLNHTEKYGEMFMVLPETVGQYTGLTDKNGKKIFEGDILKIARVSDSIGSYYFPPLVYPVNAVVRWDMCAWTWETLCKDKRYIHFPDAWCHYECEVIGNIHDNPELMKGGE